MLAVAIAFADPECQKPNCAPLWVPGLRVPMTARSRNRCCYFAHCPSSWFSSNTGLYKYCFPNHEYSHC